MSDTNKPSSESSLKSSESGSPDLKSLTASEPMPLAQALRLLMPHGEDRKTVLELPKFKIKIPKESKKSATPIDELEVEIMSEETTDTMAMHMIYRDVLVKTQAELRVAEDNLARLQQAKIDENKTPVPNPS